MNNLMKMKKNQKGFTLMEMLIVVAIIAVMVAILIPTVSKSLNKSKEATDIANLRTMYSDAQADYLSKENPETITFDIPKLNFAGEAAEKENSGIIDKSSSKVVKDASADKAQRGVEVAIATNTDGVNTPVDWAERTFYYYAKDTGKTYQITLGKNGCFEPADNGDKGAYPDMPIIEDPDKAE